MTEANPTPTGQNMPNREVLVVEDEELSWQGLEVELKKRGFVPTLAQDAEEARQLLGRHAYAAVILDLMIPKTREVRAPEPAFWGYGVEVLRDIRKGDFGIEGTDPEVPVFILTCILEEEARHQVRDLRPERTFTKPTAPGIVAEAVRLCLEDTQL